MGNNNISLVSGFVILIALIALLCAIAIFLLAKKRTKAVWFLILYFFLFFLQYTFAAFNKIGFFPEVSWERLDPPIAYAGSAFFYLFVQFSLRKDFKIWPYNSLVFIPSILFSIVAVHSFYTGSLLEFSSSDFVFISMQIFEVLLIALSLQTIRWYKKNVLNTQSSLKKHQYNWISFIVIALAVYAIYPIQLGLLSRYASINVDKDLNFVISVSTAILFLFVILLKTLFNAKNTIPLRNEAKPKETQLNSPPLKLENKKEIKTNLTEDIEDLFKQIKEEFEEKKLFLDSELNLHQLADYMGGSPREISNAINRCAHQNFYDFINSYRIKEAKNILSSTEGEAYTISEIMYRVGYNSKSSFHTAFKKHVGLTPSAYRKKQLNGGTLKSDYRVAKG